ncbi:MAG: methyltransferase domain-containing protein, partial [Anaerolineae bacterium]|nr:methyltransferase domain-containing protein [Anaerolineae bacterium]
DADRGLGAMIWVALGLGLPILVLLGLLAYWQLVIAEGTHLGPRVVTLLYDWSARAYERIKQYDTGDEQWFLGLPLARALELIPAPLVLDVATGTGRLPRALMRQPPFEGRVIGLDLSRRMLAEAVGRTSQFADRLTYIWQDARRLPFDADTFDAVTCLEALEFTPNPREVLAELVRVLRPGGVLLVTNRIGRDAKLLPGRAFPREEFDQVLAEFPLEDIKVRPWQMDYDLAWAIKTGTPRGGSIRPLPEILRCPACAGRLSRTVNGFHCADCERVYPIAKDGVIEMARTRNARATD